MAQYNGLASEYAMGTDSTAIVRPPSQKVASSDRRLAIDGRDQMFD